MSEKRKSTLKAKVLTAILIILFAGSCAAIIFAICTGSISRENNTNPTETSAVTETPAVTETAADTEATTLTTVTNATTAAQGADSSIKLGSAYNVDYWVEYKEENGSAGLGVLFGARTQGAVVTFEGDRFTVSTVSSNETADVASGSFSFISDSEIQLRYDNSNIATAKVIETENGTVSVLDIPMDIEGTTLRASIAQ